MTASVIHAESLGKAMLPESPLGGNSKTRIPELDGIRGLAIGMVLLCHLYFSTIDAPPRTVLSYIQAATRLTWSGVDLFFVLSGFLIGGILLDHRSATNYFRVFYTRRFFRIVPAYVVCLAMAFILLRLAQPGAVPRLSFLSAINTLPWAPHLFFLQNFWMAARNSAGFLGLTWSLAVEEQFYLTFPMVVRFLNPRRLLLLVCAVILAAPLIRLAFFLFWPGHDWAGFALLPCRADALVLGVLAAIAMRDPQWRARLEHHRTALLLALGVLGAGLVVLTKFSFRASQLGLQTVGFTWIALFYFCFLLYALTSPQSWISRLLRWRPLCWLGMVAYGAYLYHTFIARILFGIVYSDWPKITDLRSAGLSTLALLLTLLLCRVSWVYFEKPLLKLGHRSDYEFAAAAKNAALPLSAPQHSPG